MAANLTSALRALESVVEWCQDQHDMPQDASARLEWYARRMMQIKNAATTEIESLRPAILDDKPMELPAKTPMEQAIESLEALFGNEYPQNPRSDFKYEKEEGNTRIEGYWEWVVHQIESEGVTVDEVLICQRFTNELENCKYSSAFEADAAVADILGGTGWEVWDDRYIRLSDALCDLAGRYFPSESETPSEA